MPGTPFGSAPPDSATPEQMDANYFWAWYDLACLDALENSPAATFPNLCKSIECGFKDADYLKRDPDFKSIRRDPRWKVVLRTIAELRGQAAQPRITT